MDGDKQRFVVEHRLDRMLEAIWRRYGSRSFTATQFAKDFALSVTGAVRILNKMARMGFLRKIGYRRYVLAR